MAVKNKFDLKDKVKELQFRFNVTIPKTLAKDAKDFFVENFDKQGFDTGTIEKWKPRKSKRFTHPILVKSGALKRSVRVKSVSRKLIILSSELPYSRIHNDGLDGLAFGKYPFKMPKRQFMGHSPALTRKLQERLVSMINDVFQK
jgi:phage gpG-like protein